MVYNFFGDFMTIVFTQVLQLLIFAGIGFALAKGKIVNADHSKLLSALVVYVFMPATVFKTFSTNFTVQYIKEKYYYLLVGTAVLISVAVAAHFMAKLLSRDAYERNVYKYSLTVPNSGYMGYALCEAVYGSATLLNVIIFALPITVYCYSIGYCILTKSKLNLKKLLNPPVIAILIGATFGLSGLTLPSTAEEILSKASSCLGPVCMLLTGMAVSQFKLTGLLKIPSVYIVTFLRLVAIPCAIALVLSLFCPKEAILAVIMIYSMPCGLNTIVFPKLVGENCERGAALALISHILSCVTIPLCIYLFG